jgi:hypothetical protein
MSPNNHPDIPNAVENPIRSDGVLPPENKIFMAFQSPDDLQGALNALLDAGFQESELLVFSPQQMRRQMQTNIDHAGPLASIGQDMNLLKTHLALAEQGHGYVVVLWPKSDHEELITQVAVEHNAARAQKFGRLIIEELVEPHPGQQQHFESPDRGLDRETHR